LIYTTGKSGDFVPEGLWPYAIVSKSGGGVQREEHYNWTMNSVTEADGTITVDYSQSLDKTQFSRATESVTMRPAWGSSNLQISYHGFGNYADGSLELNLLTGAAEFVAADYTLEDVHGVLMWFAWAVLAPIGIMASAFRWLFPPKQPLWFQIHRGVQAAVVILTLIGFIIALVFTADKQTEHFSNKHMVAGLIITMIALSQPINAFFRAHVPKDGEEKTTARKIWEYSHKGLGYFAWILSEFAIMFGLFLRKQDTLAYVHMFGWCLVMLMVYVGLSIIGCRRKKEQEELATANADHENATDEFETGQAETMR